MLLSLAVALLMLLLAVRLVERRRPGMLSSITRRLRAGWLAACLLPALVVSAGVAPASELYVPIGDPLVGCRRF